jgi:hypothetical protein
LLQTTAQQFVQLLHILFVSFNHIGSVLTHLYRTVRFNGLAGLLCVLTADRDRCANDCGFTNSNSAVLLYLCLVTRLGTSAPAYHTERRRRDSEQHEQKS